MDILCQAADQVQRTDLTNVWFPASRKLIRMDLQRYKRNNRKGGVIHSVYDVNDDYVINVRIFTCKKNPFVPMCHVCFNGRSHHRCMNCRYTYCLEKRRK